VGYFVLITFGKMPLSSGLKKTVGASIHVGTSKSKIYTYEILRQTNN
jgi:hypothetical protein